MRSWSIDDPVSKYYPEWKGKEGSERSRIRQLLDHTSGMQSDGSQEVESSPDVVELALAAELTDEPGTHFYYNNKAVNLLAGIVQKASGKKMDALLQSDVFGPLGGSRTSFLGCATVRCGTFILVRASADATGGHGEAGPAGARPWTLEGNSADRARVVRRDHAWFAHQSLALGSSGGSPPRAHDVRRRRRTHSFC